MFEAEAVMQVKEGGKWTAEHDVNIRYIVLFLDIRSICPQYFERGSVISNEAYRLVFLTLKYVFQFQTRPC